MELEDFINASSVRFPRNSEPEGGDEDSIIEEESPSSPRNRSSSTGDLPFSRSVVHTSGFFPNRDDLRLTVEDKQEEEEEEDEERRGGEEREEEEDNFDNSSESLAFSDLCNITGLDPNRKEDREMCEKLKNYLVKNEVEKKILERKRKKRLARIRTMFSFSDNMYTLTVKTSLFLLFYCIMIGGAATSFYRLWTLEEDKELEISLWITFLFSVLNYGSKPYEPYIVKKKEGNQKIKKKKERKKKIRKKKEKKEGRQENQKKEKRQREEQIDQNKDAPLSLSNIWRKKKGRNMYDPEQRR